MTFIVILTFKQISLVSFWFSQKNVLDFKAEPQRFPLPKASLPILAMGFQFMKQELNKLHGREILSRCIFLISFSCNYSLNA